MEEKIITKPNRNVWLDAFRYFLAFLVVCIHVSHEVFGFDFLPICRLAVPMFFMIAGFFSFSVDKEKELSKSKNALKRNLKYFVIAFSIYLIYDIIKICIGNNSMKDYFYKIFNQEMFFNFFILNKPTIGGELLWFMIAMLILSAFHYVLVKFNKSSLYKILAPFCIIVFMSSRIIQSGINYWYLRNWFFLGVPCFGFGYILKSIFISRKNNKWQYGVTWGVLAVLTFVLAIFERMIIIDASCYISSILSSVFFLCFFDYVSKRERKEASKEREAKFSEFFYKWIGAKGAYYIYIIHALVKTVLTSLFSISGFSFSIIVFIVSFAIYEIFNIAYVLIKQKKQNKKQIEQKQ